jgi:hypothetical protein
MAEASSAAPVLVADDGTAELTCCSKQLVSRKQAGRNAERDCLLAADPA